jgi:hypothetical protein
MMESYIMKNFFNCLKDNKKIGEENLKRLSDFELISNICINERLTAYNFLTLTQNKSKKEVKTFLNSQYMAVLKGVNTPPKFDNSFLKVKFEDVFEIYQSKDLNDNSLKV